MRRRVILSSFILGCLLLAACQQKMADQPRSDPLESSAFFEDGRSARPLVTGTVARGHLKTDLHLYTGTVGGAFAATFPFRVTREVLERGQERYGIFCSPCHDHVGTGRGMVVQRGLQPPASFHIERLRKAPVGYFFNAITNGFGSMYSYASRIPARDRWAIIAYIRALQLSQRTVLADAPAEEQQRLLESNP